MLAECSLQRMHRVPFDCVIYLIHPVNSYDQTHFIVIQLLTSSLISVLNFGIIRRQVDLRRSQQRATSTTDRPKFCNNNSLKCEKKYDIILCSTINCYEINEISTTIVRFERIWQISIEPLLLLGYMAARQ